MLHYHATQERILVALNPDSDNRKREAMISIGVSSCCEERQTLEFQEHLLSAWLHADLLTEEYGRNTVDNAHHTFEWFVITTAFYFLMLESCNTTLEHVLAFLFLATQGF